MSRLNDIAGCLSGLAGWRRMLVVFAAGAAAGLAMPPLGWWPALFVSFPVFVWIIDGAAKAGRRMAFLFGWLFGFGYFSVCLHWIGFAFLVDADTYLWMMPFMVGGLAAGMAIYWGLAALLMRFLWCDGLARIVLTASAFAAAEWLRGHLFTGFPWAAIGLAADGMGGVLQLASLVGMTGLTFLIALWASLPAMLAGRRGHRTESGIAVALLLLLPLSWTWGVHRLATESVGAVPGVKLRIVQPNIPQSDKWRADNGLVIFDKLLTMSKRGETQLAGASHIIWPESAVPFLIDESEEAKAMLDSLLPDGTVLVTGSLRRERNTEGQMHVFNSIIGFDGSANVVVRYDKWRLVPGGEFLPFEWLLEPLGFRKVVTVPGSFAAGIGPVALPVPGAPNAGFLICYEAIFPDRLVPEERPHWLVNVTNDGWFGDSSGPYQHLAQARMRAVEQGLPLVRAANTGISAVIDPYGRIIDQIRVGRAGILDASLPEALATTIYARTGDWLLTLFLFTAVAFVLWRNHGSNSTH